MRFAWAGLVLLLAACGGKAFTTGGAGSDGGGDDASGDGAPSQDASLDSGDSGAGGDAADAELSCSDLSTLMGAAEHRARKCDPANLSACKAQITDVCNCQIAVSDPNSPDAQTYEQLVKAFNAKGCQAGCGPPCQTPEHLCNTSNFCQ